MESRNRNNTVEEVSQTVRRRIVKMLLRLMYSDVGLALLIIFYVVFGACLFKYLENDAGIQKCEEGKNKDRANLKKYAQTIYNYIALNMTDIDRLQFSEVSSSALDYTNGSNMSDIIYQGSIEEWLVELRNSVLNISEVYKFAGQPCHVNSWIFESSILYTITLITTIGYGHITPITWDGQIVSMCFSLIGIPLFLLWISRLSLRFGKFFRAFYSRVLLILKYVFCPKKLCCKGRSSRPRRSTIRSDVFSKVESVEVSTSDEEMTSASIYYNESIEDIFLNTQSRFEVFRKPIKKVAIPLYIVILILGLYVYVGSLVLNYLEGWNFTEAIYFSFVSMSTIGFGDFVPGIKNYKNKSSSLTDGMRILYGITYLIFGIAVIAMCYDLIQEDLFIKYTKLKLFLSNSAETDDDLLSGSSRTKNTISNYIKLMQERKEKTN